MWRASNLLSPFQLWLEERVILQLYTAAKMRAKTPQGVPAGLLSQCRTTFFFFTIIFTLRY